MVGARGRTLTCGVSAIHGERVSNDEARARAAQPQNSGGNLLSFSETADRLFLQDVFHRLGLFRDHGRHHGRFDSAGANGVDADASRSIFKSGALREPNDAVFGGMVDGAAWNADEAADG